MANQGLTTAWTKIDSGSWQSSRTYIDAGNSASNTYISALDFGSISGSIKSMTLFLYRNDGYGNTRTIQVSASTSYSTTGTVLKNETFSAADGWKSVDLTAYAETLKTNKWIVLRHGSGLNSYIQFYKTGTNAPYLAVETNSGIIRYYTSGAWASTEVYYHTSGAWVRCIPYYFTGGAWKEIG